LLLKMVVTIVMLAGLVGTLLPKIPGTIIIFLAVLGYGALTEFRAFTPWIWTIFVALMIVAELGGRWLRIYLTRRFSLSRKLSTSTAVAHLGGILAADTLLGPVLGLIVWELIAGKALEPHGTTMSKILFRLAAVALVRFICGLVMIALALMYLFN
jgi:uncharacterized protein YqgC (DUF456 family)